MPDFRAKLIQEMAPMKPGMSMHAMDLLNQAVEIPAGYDEAKAKAVEYARTLSGIAGSLGPEQRSDENAVQRAVHHILGGQIRIT